MFSSEAVVCIFWVIFSLKAEKVSIFKCFTMVLILYPLVDWIDCEETSRNEE